MIRRGSQTPGPACPRCGAPLPATKRWLGLVRRYGERCQRCGARLGYDLAGGVHVIETEDEETHGQRRGE